MVASSRPASVVLFVDDTEDNREMYGQHLRAAGIEVHLATNGLDGFNQARLLRPDVIVLDLAMPGINGFDTMRLLRTEPKTARIPVIALTGYPRREFVERALQQGFDAFLAKPCSADVLIAEIERRRRR